MSDPNLTKWLTGIAAVLVAAAVVGLWTTMQSLTGAVSDLKTTNAEVRGAIDRLGDRLEAAARLTDLSMGAIVRQTEGMQKHLEAVDMRVRRLEQDNPDRPSTTR